MKFCGYCEHLNLLRKFLGGKGVATQFQFLKLKCCLILLEVKCNDSANIRRCFSKFETQTMVLLMLVGRCKDCAKVVQEGEKMQRRPNYLCKRTQDSDEEKMHPSCGNIPAGQSQEMRVLENLTTKIFAFKTNLVLNVV